jgi:hypothetical protein
MLDLNQAVPMRWPSGPLDIALRDHRERQVLDDWHRPASLEILKGTPVNCLLVTWAAGLPEDAEQQRTLEPLLSAGREAGISFVAWIGGKAGQEAAAAAARARGLAVVPMTPRSGIDWNAPMLAIGDNVWPGVQVAVAGASGPPWVDSNDWFLQMVRARAPAANIWMIADPPGGNTVVPPERYPVTVADVAVHGARWVVSLDDHFRAGLAAGDAAAVAAWRNTAATIRFFEERPEWRRYRPMAAVAVMSDFEAKNEFLAGEIMNLMARRRLPFRVIGKDGTLDGIKAVVALDGQAPESALEKRLLAFAAAGGLLVVGRAWKARPAGLPDLRHPRFDVWRTGSGRMAVSKEESPDPYWVAGDVHLLLGHANDPYRLHNEGSHGCHYAAAPDGRSAILDIVTYSSTERDLMTVWFHESYRSARLWTAHAPKPEPLRLAPQKRGVEVYLPLIRDYAAVEVTR